MVTFVNYTGTIGVIYSAFTQNVTGSEFLTLLGIIIMIMLFFMLFRIPIEATAILILPIVIIFMSFSSDILGIGLALLMYLGLLFAKNFIF